MSDDETPTNTPCGHCPEEWGLCKPCIDAARIPSVGMCLLCAYAKPIGTMDCASGVSVCIECRDKARRPAPAGERRADAPDEADARRVIARMRASQEQRRKDAEAVGAQQAHTAAVAAAVVRMLDAALAASGERRGETGEDGTTVRNAAGLGADALDYVAEYVEQDEEAAARKRAAARVLSSLSSTPAPREDGR